MCSVRFYSFIFFFFNAPATTEIYTLSLHDALPIWPVRKATPCPAPSQQPSNPCNGGCSDRGNVRRCPSNHVLDRKSTRLNSSHPSISYAVFCLKKKNISSFSTSCRPITTEFTLTAL